MGDSSLDQSPIDTIVNLISSPQLDNTIGLIYLLIDRQNSKKLLPVQDTERIIYPSSNKCSPIQHQPCVLQQQSHFMHVVDVSYMM